MSIPCKSLLVLWIPLIILTSNAYSGIISGTGVLDKGSWDFSDTTSVSPESEDADFFVIITALTLTDAIPLETYIGTNYPAMIAVIRDSTFEELKFAPPDTSSLYDYDALMLPNQFYVIKTHEGHYAKFRFLKSPVQHPMIEYVYQPDGSRRLFDAIGVERYSWGAIKSMFRTNTSRE